MSSANFLGMKLWPKSRIVALRFLPASSLGELLRADAAKCDNIQVWINNQTILHTANACTLFRYLRSIPFFDTGRSSIQGCASASNGGASWDVLGHSKNVLRHLLS